MLDTNVRSTGDTMDTTHKAVAHETMVERVIEWPLLDRFFSFGNTHNKV